MLDGRLRVALGVAIALLSLCVGSAKKSKRWTYPRPQWPVPGHRMDATPCNLFVWNLLSATKFCKCSRLMRFMARTSLFEDSHAQLWLRIPYSSSLCKLFPCQQHSLTRCVKCGHDYRSHSDLSIERTKGRPFDQLLRKSALVGSKNLCVDYREVSSLLKGDGESEGGDSGQPGLTRVPKPVGTKNNEMKGNSTSTSSSSSSRTMNSSADSTSTGGSSSSTRTAIGPGWRRSLVAIAESQRTTLLQLSGVTGVSSVAARAAFREAQEESREARAAEVKLLKKNGGGGRVWRAGARGDERLGEAAPRGGGGRSRTAGRQGSGGAWEKSRRRRRRRQCRPWRLWKHETGGDVGTRGSRISRGSVTGETDEEVAKRNLLALDKLRFL